MSILITVVYKGKDKALLTDYNGKRICCIKDTPLQIEKVVYDTMINSQAVDPKELIIIPTVEKQPSEVAVTPEPIIKKKLFQKGKKKK